MAVLKNNVHDKDPDATKRYYIDWSPFLDGSPLLSTEWLVPEGMTSSQEDVVGDITSIRLSGGVLGDKYRVTNRITYGDGEQDDGSLFFRISES